ncbi:MAG: DUF5597 domain-containing protein [Thermoguttaceae bacterium]
MKVKALFCSTVAYIFALAVGGSPLSAASDPDIPHLRKQATATQLIVDGKPFLVLTGELEDSTSTSLDNLRPIWPTLVKMNLNTVFPVAYWGLLEPEEGTFNFTLVDGIIQEARRHNLRVGFVWFASWKNGLSLYAPIWVKKDFRRFPCAQARGGKGLEFFSAIEGYGDATRDADARAFAALMRHIREVDAFQHTVIMMQVENEVGMSIDTRDRSPAANKAYEGPVPKELMDYLQQHKETLIPEFRKVWEAAGFKTSGTWEEVFGQSTATDEIFMAWHYARYVGRVAAAGKAEYPLPMFVNAALHRSTSIADAVGKLRGSGTSPGRFGMGGPMDDLLDVWRAGAPAIDMLSPDAYSAKDFAAWCGKYSRAGNPLFIAETSGGPGGAPNALYAIGLDALGSSVYGVEFNLMRNDPANELGRVYKAVSQLMPLIVDQQGKGTIASVLLYENGQVEKVRLGAYTMSVGFGRDRRPGGSAPPPPPSVRHAGAIFVPIGPDEFYVVASNEVQMAISFTPNTPGPPLVEVGMVDEGSLVDGHWVQGMSYVDHRTGANDLPLLLPAAFHRRDAHSEHNILRVRLYRHE